MLHLLLNTYVIWQLQSLDVTFGWKDVCFVNIFSVERRLLRKYL